MKKRLWAVALALLLLLPLGQAGVQAENRSFKDFGEGSGKILLSSDGQDALMGKTFFLKKVFEIERSEGGESLKYSFAGEEEAQAVQEAVFQTMQKDAADCPVESASAITVERAVDYMQSLSKEAGAYSDYRVFSECLAKCLLKTTKEKEVFTIDAVDENGTYTVKGLMPGYYMLLDQTEKDKDGGRWCASGLVCLDNVETEKDIVIKSDLPVIKKKIREDDNRETIMHGGWNDIGDFEIGQKIPFKFETRIFNMTGMEACDYTFHDRMDAGLEFAGQVAIEIKGGDRAYALKDEEFEVITEPPNAEDTFLIHVPDIKKIVDREFPDMPAYGQKVLVTFEGCLGKDAAWKLGRPGFENDVCLVYTNEYKFHETPRKGRTPWDTTICYTFGLDLTKKNNDDKKLKGAVFRLFRDEEKKDPVLFEAGEKGLWIVTDKTDGIAEIVSDENGKVCVAGLDSDTYYLEEVKAPTGYRCIKALMPVEITATYMEARNAYVKGEGERALESLTGHMQIRPFFNGKVFSEDQDLKEEQKGDGILKAEILNRKGTELPKTGSGRLLLLSVCGLLITGLGYYVGKDK